MKKLALLAGHNRSKKGAKHEGINEFDYTSALIGMIQGYIENRLEDIDVKIFYRTDFGDKRMEFDDITQRINEFGPNLTLEFHLNSFATAAAAGTEILIAPNVPVNNGIAPMLQRVVAETLGTKNRPFKTIRPGESGWPIQSALNNERLLVELFFLSNPHDRTKGIQLQRALAENIAACVIRYLEVKNEY